MHGAAALLLLVARPLAAAWAAQQGIGLTPSAPARAVERLTRAVRLDPVNELYWVKLGAAAQAHARSVREAPIRRASLEQARAAFERAIRLSPANSYNHANLGRALADLAQSGDAAPGAAFAAFDRALQIDPNNAYFYADAANAALTLGDYERAREYAERGSQRYPRFALTRALLGHIALARRGRRKRWSRHSGGGRRLARGGALRVAAASNLAAAYPARAPEASRRGVALERASGLPTHFNRAERSAAAGAPRRSRIRQALADQPDHTPPPGTYAPWASRTVRSTTGSASTALSEAAFSAPASACPRPTSRGVRTGPGRSVVLLHLQGELAAAESARFRLDGFEQSPCDALSLVILRDVQVVDVDERPRRERR